MKALKNSEGAARKIFTVGAGLAGLGIAQEFFLPNTWNYSVRGIVWVALLVCYAWYLYEIVWTTLNDWEKGSAKGHYGINRQARKERAHYIIHRLLMEGENLKNANPERRQEWDRRAIKALSDYCGRNALFRYLSITQRLGDDGTSQPIEEFRYNYALETLSDFIKEDFQYSLD